MKKEILKFEEAYNSLRNIELKKNLCKIETIKALAIGGRLAYEGKTEKDVDIIIEFTEKYLEKTEEEQINILNKIRAVLPRKIRGKRIDMTFFEVRDEQNKLITYGARYDRPDHQIWLYKDKESEMPEEIKKVIDRWKKNLKRDKKENIWVFKC